MIRNDIETIRSIIRKYMLMIPTARFNETVDNAQNGIRNALLNPVDYIMTERRKHDSKRNNNTMMNNDVSIHVSDSYMPNTLPSNSDLVIMNMLSDIRNANIDYNNEDMLRDYDEHDFKEQVIRSIHGFIGKYSYNNSGYCVIHSNGMLMSISRIMFHNLRIRRIMMMPDADIIAFNAVLRILHEVDLIIVGMNGEWRAVKPNANDESWGAHSISINDIEKAAVMLVQGYPDEFIMEVLKASL